MSKATLDFGPWDVDTLRLTVFHPPLSGPSAVEEIWERVAGHKPESIDKRPREAITRVTGKIGPNGFLLTIALERLDWLIRPTLEPSHVLGTALTVKNAENILPVLKRSLQHSLDVLPSVTRLAFGPVLIRQVDSPKSGLSELADFIHISDLDSLEGTDFTYKINRRKSSTAIPNVLINRLATWSMGQIEGVEVVGKPSAGPQVSSARSSFVRTLHLDVNTVSNTLNTSNENIPDLFEELVQMAVDLAQSGDIH